jgi:hypothetical protein
MKRSPLLAILLLLPLALALSPGRARADDSKRAKAAKEAFGEGRRLYEERRYVNAVAAFERAYVLRPHFLVQCSIARCYENLSDVVKAARHYRRCLDEGAAKAKMAERVQISLKAAEARITWLTVASPGKGGTIHVDGDAVGQAPGRVPINPGRHVVEVRREGARPASTPVSTLGGEKLEVTLIPVALEAPAPSGAPTVVKRPAPESEPEPAASGRRRLPQYWFWGAAGATAVLTVVAIVLGVQTLDARSDYEADPTAAGYDAFVDKRLATNLVWLTTALAAGASTWLFFYTDFGWGKQDAAGSDTAALSLGLRGTF